MGMGASACSGWLISYENLKEMCPKEIDLVEGAEEFDNWGEVAKAVEFSDDELPVGIQKAVESLLEVFSNNTGGLTLCLGSYDEDSGDRYDEVDAHEGCVFYVGGMVALTPAGEKFKSVVNQRFWTQFG